MQCGQNVQLFNVKLLVHHVTGRLLKVNDARQCHIYQEESSRNKISLNEFFGVHLGHVRW